MVIFRTATGRPDRRGARENEGMAMPPPRRVNLLAVILVCLVGPLPTAVAADATDRSSQLEGAQTGFVDVTEAVGLSYRIAAGNEDDDMETVEAGRELSHIQI